MSITTFCNHCRRSLPDAFEPGGPCPGCESIGHAGHAWECAACGQDPGPDQKPAQAKSSGRAAAKKKSAVFKTPRLDRMKRAKQASAHAAPADQRVDWSGAPAWLVEAVQRVDQLKLEDFDKLTALQLNEVCGVIETALNQIHNTMLSRLLTKTRGKSRA